jgi:thymidylate synthase
MVSSSPEATDGRLALLIVTQGQWGERIADNIGQFHPPSWVVERWPAPKRLPLVIDDPTEYLPACLPATDLVLALGETPGVAQLIPDIVKQTGARSVIAPIDRNESLPPGLMAQLGRWLAALQVAVVFPKPFCSLTETSYNVPSIQVEYHDAAIGAFARSFGKPRFGANVTSDGQIGSMWVQRDSACGCARFVAQGLTGQALDQVESEAGMLHHHYPCLASMNQDADYHDTLMHVSGRIVREAAMDEIRDSLAPAPYLRPEGRVDADPAG